VKGSSWPSFSLLYCNRIAFQGPLTEDIVAKHTAVVWCGGSREELLKWDACCRAHKVVFIAVGTLGATGYIFSDFGAR
jgi:hypothetical protein